MSIQNNEKNEKVRQLYDRLKTGVQDILASGRIDEVLKFQAKFHKYSFGNIMLILHQFPDATQVAGYNRWKELGRYVRKGEHGIRIFAPCPYRRTVMDEHTGEETEKTITYFRVVTVFDVSQTEGSPLPGCDEGSAPVEDTLAGEALYNRLLSVSPVPVRFDECRGDGYYSIDRREIVLARNLDGDQRAGTLLHEVAHALAFQTGEQQRHRRRGDEEYVKGEVVAEGAAFVAASYFGIAVPGSFDYVAGWAKRPEVVIKWGDAVQRVAAKLIDLVEVGKAA
ncbi:MAG: ArdC family protein [Peptococcaceae bacterium]|jgi:antirestriction protein ArdC|nr:ArdC family protein [Peptococcaceae bacterium]